MTNRAAAARYARALLDVAVREGADLDAIERELAAFLDLGARHPELARVLLNAAVPAPRKRAAVAEIVKAAGVAAITGKLLVLLAERDRLVLVPDLLAAYRDRLLDHRKVVRADVTTAAPLSAAGAQAIERGLSRVTGRTVQLSTAVDPSIVGGVVARVGSVIYDGSVVRQLEKLKETIATGGTV
jgi:F-type H+-transporting ATPase subunit delta